MRNKPEEFKKGIIRKDLILTTCGQSDHLKGCKIRFSNKKVVTSDRRHDVVVDYDKDGNVVGIEFWEGL